MVFNIPIETFHIDNRAVIPILDWVKGTEGIELNGIRAPSDIGRISH
jgi:hypothetical protein